VVIVSPAVTISYQVTGFDEIWNTSVTSVLPKPSQAISKSNDIDCIEPIRFRSDQLQLVPGRLPIRSFQQEPTGQRGYHHLVLCGSQRNKWLHIKRQYRRKVDRNSPANGYPIANAFTPNGDGHNDCFGIKYWGYIGNVEMMVYNRWGVRVFYSKSRDGCSDGTYQGRPQLAVTYVYIIKANTFCGNVVRKGTLELIR
jgi:gliding motility-associated-like protein